MGHAGGWGGACHGYLGWLVFRVGGKQNGRTITGKHRAMIKCDEGCNIHHRSLQIFWRDNALTSATKVSDFLCECQQQSFIPGVELRRAVSNHMI